MTAADRLIDTLDQQSAQLAGSDGLVTAMAPEQRLEMSMRRARGDDPSAGLTTEPSGSFSDMRVGVPNPNGRGLAAFEPNTILGSAYGAAYQQSKASEAADAAAATTSTTITAPVGDGTGKVGKAVAAAMDLANRRVPYVWGGSSRNGVDCSGLIAYAFQSAGIDFARVRAADLGKMGTEVTSLQEAQPGDLIYYDSGPGDASNTDHVGLYIGNGQMIAAPQTGDVVKVQAVYGHPTSIRRLFTDNSMQTTVGPDGGPGGYSYNGMTYQPWLQVSTTVTRPGTGNRWIQAF
jgi:cell wall-associated NlpC family hydrolase